VEFDDGLRHEVEQLAGRMREIHGSGVTPRAVYAKKCDSCSMLRVCIPKVASK
jgi:CRISPR-associated exonuclease Cas4